MSRSFTAGDGQSIQIPADAIFNSPTAVTLAAWVNISDYGANGFPVLLKDPGVYQTYLYVDLGGTLTGFAGGPVPSTSIFSWSIQAAGLGYSPGDGGTVQGGTVDADYAIFTIGAGGAVTNPGSGPAGGQPGDGFTLNQICTTTATSGIGVGLTLKVTGFLNPTFGGSTSNETVPLSGWHHVAMTWDSGTDGLVRLYIDGVETTYSGQTPSTLLDTSTGGYDIASDGFGDEGTELIDETAIYSTALSGAQVAALAASTTGATGAPIGYWHLCGNISPEPDASGNGNAGLLFGSPLPSKGATNSPGYNGCVSAKATSGSVGVGSYGGKTLAEAFYNPHNLDLLQVVNEGGDVVWNLTYDGTATASPGSSTHNALLGVYAGETFALAFPNPYSQDILQIIGPGDTVEFWVDSTGAAHT